ncbi:MAG: prephenate dehydratase [Candidatus Altiarchaeota archaeon]
MKGIDELRSRIDEIDRNIISLLEERMNLVGKIGGEKKESGLGVYDPKRERGVIEKLAESSFLDKRFIERLYSSIFSFSRQLQERGKKSPVIGSEGLIDNPTVAVLGPRKTFSSLAAEIIFAGKKEIVFLNSFDEIFEAVEKGDADYGVAPIENSLEGSINRTLDLLLEKDLYIVAEDVSDIHLCLLCSKNSDLESIKYVSSHPHAIAQCARFIKTELSDKTSKSSTSTAQAAYEASIDPSIAAIGPIEAAEEYGLKVLKENIEDDPSKTRFIVLSKNKGVNGSKTSIIFAVADRPGSLFGTLREFSEKKLNLTKIESRPSRNHLGEYIFFVDFEGNLSNPVIEEVLKSLKDHTSFLKVLGSY